MKGRHAWILTVLRYGLLLAAAVYLYYSVTWHDYAVLVEADGGHQRARIVEDRSDAGTLVVLRDDQPVTIALTDVARAGDSDLPDIRRGIASVVRGASLTWIIVALIIIAPVPLFQAWRLVWMLAVQDVRLTSWSAIKLTFVGNFFNFALPGTTGGDLVKAYYLTQHTHRKAEAVTTVFLDRVVGTVGVVLIASVMLLTRWNTAQFGHLALIPLLVGVFIAVGGLFVLHPGLRRALHLRDLAERLPFNLGGLAVRIGRATVALGRHRLHVAGALLLTLILQFLVYFSIIALSWALHMTGDVLNYLIFIPITFMLAAVPIAPPQGLGIMEGAFIQFFAGPNSPNHASQAVALALGFRFMQLFWALPGALVPLLGAHLPRASELAELEETPVLPDSDDVPPVPATLAPGD